MPMSREKLTFLKLCQVQIITYSLTLYIVLTAEEREKRGAQRAERRAEWRAERGSVLPRLYFHGRRGQSPNLIYSSVNNTEPSETVPMSECVRMKLKSENENTREASGEKNEQQQISE